MEKTVHAALVTRTDDYLDWSEPYRNCDLFNRSNSPFAEFRSKNFVSPFELTFTNWLRARCARTSCLNSSLRVIETLSLSRHSPPLFSLGFLTKFRRKPRPSSSVPFELHKTSLSLSLFLRSLYCEIETSVKHALLHIHTDTIVAKKEQNGEKENFWSFLNCFVPFRTKIQRQTEETL